jgi:hypothetical protein
MKAKVLDHENDTNALRVQLKELNVIKADNQAK